ncbi:MAG: hypothetical protein ACFFCQ_01390 [Promethearchaeota archaeon]
MQFRVGTFIFLGIGLFCLGAALTLEEFSTIQQMLKELSEGFRAGVPRP